MTIHLTAFKPIPEVEAAKAFLVYQDIGCVVHYGRYYLQNNGGKGSLVAYSPDDSPIGGFFDLVDWVLNNGHAKL